MVASASQLKKAALIASLATVVWMAFAPTVVSAQMKPFTKNQRERAPIRVPEPATVWLVVSSVSALMPTAYLLRRRRK